MEGVLALMIPVLALATGMIAVLRMPPEALAAKRGRYRHVEPAADNTALIEEVSMLREELAQLRERVDFTERLLAGPTPNAAPLGAAAVPRANA